jgi:hypothetical protein
MQGIYEETPIYMYRALPGGLVPASHKKFNPVLSRGDIDLESQRIL